jgi:hypothetical protein
MPQGVLDIYISAGFAVEFASQTSRYGRPLIQPFGRSEQFVPEIRRWFSGEIFNAR